MYKVNDYVVYKKDVCLVKEIKSNKQIDQNYYVLVPVDDQSLFIQVPVENKLGNIREIITKKEVNDIIDSIPNIKIITTENDKLIEHEYKKLLYDGDHKDLISIIKTTYLRNKNRLDNNKKIGEKDDVYFKKAESKLYNEFSIALNMTYDEVKEYVANKVEELTK